MEIRKTYGGSDSRRLLPEKVEFAGVSGDNETATLIFEFPETYADYDKYIEWNIEIPFPDSKKTFKPLYLLTDDSFVIPRRLTRVCNGLDVDFNLVFVKDNTLIEKSLQSTVHFATSANGDATDDETDETSSLYMLITNAHIKAEYSENDVSYRPQITFTALDGSTQTLTLNMPYLNDAGKIPDYFLDKVFVVEIFSIASVNDLISLTEARKSDWAITPEQDLYLLTGEDYSISSNWLKVYSHDPTYNSITISNKSTTGSLEVLGNTRLIGDLEVDGNVVLNDDARVKGDLVVEGSINTVIDVHASNDLSSGRDTSVGGDLSVEGNARIKGDLDVDGSIDTVINVNAQTDLTAGQDLKAGRNLEIEGESLLKGDVTAKSDVLIEGDLDVDSNLNVSQDVSVTGSVTTGTLEALQDVLIGGNAEVGGDLLVNGSINTVIDVHASNDLSSARDTTVGRDLQVEGNARVKGDLDVDGSIDTVINVNAQTDLTAGQDLKATRNLEIGGTSILKGDVLIESDLQVDGDINTLLGGNSPVVTDANGKLTVANISVSDLENLTGIEGNVQLQIDTKEDKINKVNSWAGTPSDVSYPSEKLVKSSLDTKVDKNTAITSDTKCKVTYDAKGLVTGGADLADTDVPPLSTSKIVGLDTTLSEINTTLGTKVDKNDTIVGATKAKITYDSKGLVTTGADLVASDIPNLNASKINAGTLGVDRIPNISANKITSDTLADARIPSNIERNTNKIQDIQSTIGYAGSDTDYPSVHAVQKYTSGVSTPILEAISDLQDDKADDDKVVHKAGNETITGIKSFENNVNIGTTSAPKNLVLKGDLTIEGDIVQNGSSYETHAEKVFTANDKITLRDGAVSGLVPGTTAGFLAKLYDGYTDGEMALDSSGTIRVGDVGDTQPVLTRKESEDLSDAGLLAWDSTNFRAYTRELSATDIPNLSATKITTGTLADARIPTSVERTANKRTTFQTTPSDTAYPSEKLVKDSLDEKYSASNAPPYPVTSVAGKTGAVTLAEADIPALSAGKITSGIFADARIPALEISKITGLQTAISSKVTANAGIAGGTKTKITYDSKGLVTAGADLTDADVPESVERTANKVDSWQTTPTDTAYPSEKLVKDTLENYLPKAGGAMTGAITLPTDNNRAFIRNDNQVVGFGFNKDGIPTIINYFQRVRVFSEYMELGSCRSISNRGNNDIVVWKNIVDLMAKENGIATLDNTGKIPSAQLPAGLPVNTSWGSPLSDSVVPSEKLVKDSLDLKVTANNAITAGSKCKITYDAKGLVTAGANLVASDIPALDSAKITTGTFVDARIPSLNASKITAGTFADARIPTTVERIANKVTAWQTTPTDTAYPTEKLVKDSLDAKATASDLSSHTSNTSNPHSVTKAQVGLSAVANELQYSASNPPPYPVTSVAGKTGAVVLAEADIPALSAGKITSGTFADARIPNLNGSKITAGTVADARLPTTVERTSNKKSAWQTTPTDTAYPTEKLVKDTIDAHTGNTSNPHSVTKAQVGLSNVDNTSDTAKPISTATQTALNAKQASITGGATTITSSNLTASRALVSNGSGKVAVSAVTSTELGYLDGVTSAVQTQLNSKASNTNLTAHTNRTDNPHSVTKSQVGLGNVDNTSDVFKPISTATQTALNAKADASALDEKVSKTGYDGIYGIKDFYDRVELRAGSRVHMQSNPSGDDITNVRYLDNMLSQYPNFEFLNDTLNDTVDHFAGEVGTLLSYKQDKLTFDDVPTADSANPVKSGGVYDALAGKQASITGGATTITTSNLATSRALVSDGNGKVAVSDVTSTELGYLDGVTSNVQDQLNNAVKKTGNESIAGIKSFSDNVEIGTTQVPKQLSIKGNLLIDGNITQNGSTYETHAQQVYTTDDKIIMRDGATAGLISGDTSGLKFKKYDGTNDGELSVDSSGTARVGDVGDLQPLATRNESELMTNNQPVVWDSSGLKMVTRALVAGDIPDLDAGKIKSGTIADARIPSGITRDTELTAHTSRTDNPHAVTKAQVGLGNVDNTSDVNKPISTATQTALDGKVDSNPAITAGTRAKVTYDSKGLVTAGTDLVADDIPGLPASKITSGSFSSSRLPALDASKITSGTFVDARIPALTISKTTGLQAALDGKQDKLPLDKDLHFGDVTITRTSTEARANIDMFNPYTGVGDTRRITIPRATRAAAGVMAASDVIRLDDAVDGLSTKQDKLTFDDAPVEGSDNPVKSGGIYDALQAITFEIATEEEAIGGTDNTTLMTPLRVSQAFDEKFKVIDGVLNVFENGEWVEYVPK